VGRRGPELLRKIVSGIMLTILLASMLMSAFQVRQVKTDGVFPTLQETTSPWSMFQHDAQRTGRSQYDGPNSSNPDVRIFSAEGYSNFGFVAIATDGTIYSRATGPQGTGLYAFNPDGTTKWFLDHPVGSYPTIGPDGTIYSFSDQGVIAVDAYGTLKWEKGVACHYTRQFFALGNNGTLYFMAGVFLPNGSFAAPVLVALDLDGEVSWLFDIRGNQTWLAEPGYEMGDPLGSADTNEVTSPSVGPDGVIYFGSLNVLYALTLNGAVKWEKTFDVVSVGQNIRYAPVVSSDTIYVTVNDISYDPMRGISYSALYWMNPTGNIMRNITVWERFSTPPVLSSDGTLILSTWRYPVDRPIYDLMAVSTDGAIKWALQDTNNYRTPIVDATGNIYLIGGSSEVVGLSTDGQSLWETYLSFLTPGENLGGGNILTINQDGVLFVPGQKLYAISARARYSLSITAATGGTTSPAPGGYTFESGEVATVRAWQSSEYQFDHWELDAVNVGSTNPFSVAMNTDHRLRAVFKTLESPIASFVYSPSPPLNPTIGEDIVFDASQSIGAASYTWDFNDGQIIPTTDPKITHSYQNAGTYNVKLKIGNSLEQTDITSRTVTVKKPPVILVHGFQSSDTYDEDEIWSTMKESLTNSGFAVYVSHYAWGAVTSESIRRYAESLKQEIDEIRQEDEKVHKVDIVAHSMGGLVARWYIELGGGQENVRKLIMLETPNRGVLFPGFTGLLATALGTTLIAGADPQVKTWADRISSMVDKMPSWIMSDEKKAELKLLKYAAYVSSNLARFIEITRWSSYIDIYAGLPNVDPRIIQDVHYTNIIGWLGRIPWVKEVFTLDGVATEKFTGWANQHPHLPASGEVIEEVKFILNDDPESYNQGTQELQDYETQSTPSISANISQGEEKRHEIAINNATTANFVLVWSEGLLNLTLVSPNGTVIDPSYANPNVAYYYDSNLTMKGYAIRNPNIGIWNVSVLASNIPGQSEEYTLLTYLETNATLSLELQKYVYGPNELLSIRANLTYCNQPITGATINAAIQKPDGLTENTTLYDDGLHGDNQMNDGLYANGYANTSLWGTYKMSVTATGSFIDEQLAREAFATVWVGQYPELSLNESDIDFSKETPEEGETITISATIHNVSEIDATNSSILFYDGNPANGTLLGECTINVTRGDVETASFQWNATNGMHQINVLISPYNEFQELNYTNNLASKAIEVYGHDITVLAVTYPKTVLAQTYQMPVNVTLENQGSFAENMNVTIYANTTIIGEQAIENMPNGTWTTLTFIWNTTGYDRGNYTISAYAEPAPSETYIADNTYTAGTLTVTIPGDVNGDRKVDATDLNDLKTAYGSTCGLPTWNSNCDINGDNRVDVLDLFLQSKNYGKTDP
jgi:pimeloyl-ACP methyl ester carboxylesterase